MARLLNNKVRRIRPPCAGQELAVSRKPRWEVVDGAVMNTASQVIAFVYAKVFATMPVEFLNEMLRQ
jgi:hypothetical protein